MRILFIVVCSFICLVAAGQHTVCVVDGDDGYPLAGATVFSSGGTILGVTDANGSFTVASDNVYPLTVRYLGYDAAAVSKSTPKVEMHPSSLTLGEVTVTPTDRPILHITYYVREYASGATPTDTMIFFNEHMADVLLPTREKIKGFKKQTHPRFLSSKLYTRLADSSGLDSCFIPSERNDDLCFNMLLDIPYGKGKIDTTCCTGVYRDTIAGKYGMLKDLKVQNGILYQHMDLLANYEGHKYSPTILKILGMTADFTDISTTIVCRSNDEGEYDTAGDIFLGLNIKLTGRGKMFKHYFNTHGNPIDIYNYYELYPVDVEYLTVDEAKALGKNPPRPHVVAPANAPALDPAYQRIVDRSSELAGR